MAKKIQPASTALFPLPSVMVTTAGADRPNIITLAWVGTICSSPPMLSISVRPQTYSHGLLVNTREFVLNIPGADRLKEMDLCGMVSGRDQDKFALTGLTPLPATQVKAPLIAECPVNIECRVSQIINLGLHDMFISEILAVHADENVMDEKGRIDAGKVAPVAYAGSRYWALGNHLGDMGFSRRP
ncbi:MAG TPA: flavin reductase family protein [Spirochaetia bacterium]|nr:flavin reductase family protein [Spirochaetia bacterium]